MLIFLQASISTSTLLWNCGDHNDCIAGRILLYFSFEISMTKSHSLFDLMVAGLLQFFGVKNFSLAHGWNVLLFS